MRPIMDIMPPQAAHSTSRTKFRSPKPQLGLVIAAVAIIVAGLAWQRHVPNSPVPASVRKGTPFAIYYPKQQDLPAGYALDTGSFHMADPGVVVFSVTHNGKQAIFSEEQKPDATVIDKFTKDYIPLYTEEGTKLGKARFGAIGSNANLRTVVSLPINKGPWLIITAPADINHGDMLQVVNALVK